MTLLQPLVDGIDPSPGVRLVGVAASNLGPVFHQLTLDEAAVERPGFGVAETALDEIRERFGPGAIGRASAVEGGRIRNVQRGGQQWGPDVER